MKHFLIGLLLAFLPRHSAKARELRCKYPDWRDYYDATDGYPPTHGYMYHCERCGKEFGI